MFFKRLSTNRFVSRLVLLAFGSDYYSFKEESNTSSDFVFITNVFILFLIY